ncbi:MAG: hypothetical protein NW226_09280 [Microscillaceae bacterium]|nr:hypothetical protein [Microscillaceae bacterium]
MRTAQDIIADINQFEPQDGNWLRLDALLNELWETGDEENYTDDLLKVFERFPDEAGILWSIVHGVESFSVYETELIDSLNRQPSEMGLLMLRRIKNTGTNTVGGIEIRKIADDLLSKGQITPTLRQNLIKIRE